MVESNIIEIISLTFAGTALFFSAIALGWNIHRDWINAGKLKLNAYVAKQTNMSEDFRIISITITNSGQKNIIVFRYYFLMHDKTKLIFPYDFHKFENKRLAPGEYISELIQITPDLIEKTFELKGLCIVDTVGKKWFLKKKKFNELVTDLKKIQQRQALK